MASYDEALGSGQRRRRAIRRQLAIAEQAEVVENEGSGWSERVTGAGLVGNDEALHQDQWADLQWHYLDDTGAMQARTTQRHRVVQGWCTRVRATVALMVQIGEAGGEAPFLALWSNNAEIDAHQEQAMWMRMRALASETSLNDSTTSAARQKTWAIHSACSKEPSEEEFNRCLRASKSSPSWLKS